MHRMGYSYWATETKRTNTSDKTYGFSRNYRAKDQRSLGWGHKGGSFAAGGCSVPQPLTHGKDPGFKKPYWGETTNNFQLAFSSTMPQTSHPRSCMQCCLNVYSYSQFSKLTGTTCLWADFFFFCFLEISQCWSECGCLSKAQTLECKGLDYIHCNLSLLSSDDLFHSL